MQIYINSEQKYNQLRLKNIENISDDRERERERERLNSHSEKTKFQMTFR